MQELTTFRITKPGSYKIPASGVEYLAIKETEKVDLIGDGCVIDGRNLNDPDIDLIMSKDVNIMGQGPNGIILLGTRVKAQQFSKNVRVDGVTSIGSKKTIFSCKTEFHVDNSDKFSAFNPAEFGWEHFSFTNCHGRNGAAEMFYIGSSQFHRDQKPHMFDRGHISNCSSVNMNREGCQVSHVKWLVIEDCNFINSGINRGMGDMNFQGNGLQIANCQGIIDDVIIDKTSDNGLIMWAFNMTFNNLKVNNIPNCGIFIGNCNNRFPYSPLNDGKPIVFNRPVISNCKYGINVQTDEMDVILINPIFHNCGSTFHPKSAKNNVKILRIE